jgi:hypothetical protein
VLGLIVALAAVIGGGAWLRKHNSSVSPTSAKSSTTGTISAAKISSSTSPSPIKDPFRSKSQLLAVIIGCDYWNYPITSPEVRVNYQDKTGKLVEAYQTDGSSWANTKLGHFPQNDSAIAAAITNLNFSTVRIPNLSRDC